FFGFTLLPMMASLYLAFTDYDILTPPRWIGLENFHRMFTQDRRYLQSVSVTLFYVAIAVPLRLAFALALAMLLNTQRRGMSVYRAAFYAPSIVAGGGAGGPLWGPGFGGGGGVEAPPGGPGGGPGGWLRPPPFSVLGRVTPAR